MWPTTQTQMAVPVKPPDGAGAGQPMKETLCGTKVLSRARYGQIAAQRTYGTTNIQRWRHG
jgi:hypothetical protein